MEVMSLNLDPLSAVGQADQREVGRQHGRAPDGAVDGQGARTQASSELLSTDAREAFVPSNGGSPEILLKFRLSFWESTSPRHRGHAWLRVRALQLRVVHRDLCKRRVVDVEDL